MAELDEQVRAQLASVTTATLTTLLFKRGLRNVFMQNVHPITPGLPRMVGQAYTLRYIPVARGHRRARRLCRPDPPAAQGDRALPARARAGDRQAQGRARGLGRRHPADAG